MEFKNEEILQRQLLLLKEDLNEFLINKKIAIFGIGGVGGFTLETIARNGFKNLFICDKDTVDITNINRQIIATTKTIDQKKVDVARNRVNEINPNINLVTSSNMVNKDNIKETLGDFKPDYIIDAIDDVDAKIDLIEYAKENNIKMISSMGAGNRTKPWLLKVTNIEKTSYCMMSKKMRKILRKKRIRLHKVMVVSSTEKAIETGTNTIATISQVPSTAGILLASYVINDIIDEFKKLNDIK